ncbi:CDP-diacylglycerol--glycerol-3-phosphate 3-phosphatidyltransferase [Thiorhodococcus minor]|uniref:CDP-diacylglycerol--glycerol-3-phosphate 3-phosphatidyltransferase n=1 Tax=Thiorhodococcus minor TaxID=57489 RepID=A0A6M0JTF0_9GAMM|nr:CDP-diacylglycerol--glycerol-3-phosphate 3-phosphatidyltransferase [Thiorhodococcus minor]NEV60806.1 CDP-diacylglycerol--glycerol-3-phosphate 3-phosphatidyltransferase [Thiorhodococcus minor]
MTALPNLLTASRLFLILPIMALLALGGTTSAWWALGLFLAASVTDFFDGWLARRLDCATTLGVFLDPLADKVFANVLLVYLACERPDWVPLWIVLVLLAREFAVQGFRSLAPCVGVVISTGQLNKLKLVFQLIAAGTAIGGLAWPAAEPLLKPATWLALGLALVAGVWSMITVFRDNADLWQRSPIAMEER